MNWKSEGELKERGQSQDSESPGSWVQTAFMYCFIVVLVAQSPLYTHTHTRKTTSMKTKWVQFNFRWICAHTVGNQWNVVFTPTKCTSHVNTHSCTHTVPERYKAVCEERLAVQTFVASLFVYRWRGVREGHEEKKGAAAQQSQPWQQHTRTHIKSACRPLKAHRLPLIAANWHPASQIKITSAYCTPVLPLTAEAQRGNGSCEGNSRL